MDSKIPLTLLEALVTFHKYPSTTSAAEQLGISQPALSKKLMALQALLSAPLFAQDGKRKVLTAYGEELASSLAPKLTGIDEDVRQVQLTYLDEIKAEVRLCARREVLDRIDSSIKFSGCIVFKEAAHDEIIHQVQNRTVDIGITYSAPNSLDLVSRALFKESFQVLVPKAFCVKAPSLDDLRDILPSLPRVAYRKDDEILERFATAISLRMNAKTVRITDNYSSLFRMIEGGIGWGVIPDHPGFTARKCWSLPVPPRAIQGREFRLIYRKELAKARWMKDLLTEVGRTFTPKEHD